MAAQKGRDLLLKIHDGSANFDDANYVVVGGFISNNINMSGEQIDITSKDSGSFKESLEGAGRVSVTVGGRGVFLDDASFQRVHDHFLAQTHPDCKIVIPDFAEYTGKFSVDSLGVTGDDGQAVQYDIQLTSSGTVTVTGI